MSDKLHDSEIDSEIESEESDDALSLSSSDGENDAAVENLDALVYSLHGQAPPTNKRKRHILPEATDTAEPRQGKLQLEDLLTSLDPVNAADMRKATKALQAKGIKTTTGQATGPIAVPLDSRKRAKLDRSAAREKLYDEANRWNETVKQSIGSKDSAFGHHRIQLDNTLPSTHHKATASELASRFAPKIAAEREIAAILDASQVGSAKAQSALENQAMLSLRVEEEKRAIGSLRPQRDSAAYLTKAKSTRSESPAEGEDVAMEPVASGSNPWLANTLSGKQVGKTKATSKLDAAKRGALKASKQKGKTQEAIEAANTEADVLVSTTQVLPVKKRKQKAQKHPKKTSETKSAATAQLAEIDAEEDPEDDEQITIGFNQQDLVARAFAEDHVVAEFEYEKERITSMDAPREVDETIPGWGSWGGKGVRKSKQGRKFIRSIPGIKVTDRLDADLPHVIINEKRDRKGAKYLVKDLPFPYTNARQHEQTLSQPLGSEWQTLSTQRSLTRPDVLTKAGSIISPVTLAAV